MPSTIVTPYHRDETQNGLKCASVKECRVHHCMNKVHNWLALTFDTFPVNFGNCAVLSVLGAEMVAH